MAGRLSMGKSYFINREQTRLRFTSVKFKRIERMVLCIMMDSLIDSRMAFALGRIMCPI